jgi:hypothetical protein
MNGSGVVGQFEKWPFARQQLTKETDPLLDQAVAEEMSRKSDKKTCKPSLCVERQIAQNQPKEVRRDNSVGYWVIPHY